MTVVDDLLADLASGDEARAEVAASSLAERADVVVPKLGRLLESDDVDQRWWAIRTLAEMKEPPKEWLRRALEDASGEVRAAAALALVAHPDEAAIPGLIRLLGDEETLVAHLAVHALVAIGSPAVPALIEAFEGSLPRKRIQIMRTLSGTRDQRSIPLMMRAVEEESVVLQYWAREGLDALGLDMMYLRPD